MVSEKTLRTMCEEAGIKKGIYENPRFLFTIQQVNNFYFLGNVGVNDISEGFVDGCGDGGIDYIYKNELENELYLVQGKTNKTLSEVDVNNIFDYMIRTINKIKNKDTSKLKQELADKLFEVLGSKPKIFLVLFSKNKLRDDVKDIKKYMTPERKSVELKIYDSEEIEERVFLNDPNKKVDKAELEIDSHNNVLRYEKNGYIVNVKASSLKYVYRLTRYKGLFSYNLREKINGKKDVDDNINETIDSDKEHFWYKNNGITIGCEKCSIKENKLVLEKFSIINGAQTTNNIGNSDKITNEYDFFVTCKVVIVPYKDIETAKEYLHEISVATNYQKPISLQDTHANDKEQQELRKKALANDLKLDIQIKRNSDRKKDKLKKWQYIDNLLLGQMILACIYQNPGPAKASKNSLMNTYYEDVYINTEHNYDLYFDMVMLYNKYMDFRNEYKKKINNNEIERENSNISEINSIIQEGVWTILACIFAINKINGKKVKDDQGKCMFKERLFNVDDYKKIDKKINEFFNYLAEVINRVFNNAKKNGSITTEYSSYFLKNTKNYTNYILEELKAIYESPTLGKQLKDYLDIFEK